jgi:hypothetical protein
MPLSPRFADAVWLGSACYDGWARAASITAAARHWRGCSETHAHGLAACRAWYSDFEAENRNFFKGSEERLHPTDFDWDLAAIASALCALGDVVGSVALFEDIRAKGYAPPQSNSILLPTLIAAVVDARKPRLVRHLLNRALGEPATPQLNTAIAYAHTPALGFETACPRRAMPGEFNLSAARAAHSDDFAKFVKQFERQARTYL